VTSFVAFALAFAWAFLSTVERSTSVWLFVGKLVICAVVMVATYFTTQWAIKKWLDWDQPIDTKIQVTATLATMFGILLVTAFWLLSTM